MRVPQVMISTRPVALLLGAMMTVSLGSGCIARNAEDYKTVTRDLVNTRAGAIQECYNKELENNPQLSGKLEVSFTVEKKTGKIANAEVRESSVPDSIGTCVVGNLNGLTLERPDSRDGDATFIWKFEVGKAS